MHSLYDKTVWNANGVEIYKIEKSECNFLSGLCDS